MNNSGSSDSTLNPETNQEANGAQCAHRSPSLILIILLVVAVALAVYIGTNVLGVLFAIISPPLPPVPTGLTEIAHESEAYGVDIWTYTAPNDACELVEQFQLVGVCGVAPMQCGDLRLLPDETLEASVVARCTGEQKFSIFTMQWWALVSRFSADGTTKIELEREVFWIGEGTQ